MPFEKRLAECRAEYAQVLAQLARPPGPVHLMGIGGVGMAGLAVQLSARGHAVSGCDREPGSFGPWLQQRGIRVLCGHQVDHLTPAPAWLVRSPAVPESEPEGQAARRLGLPVYVRGTVLPALLNTRFGMAVGGTHGKTTTSAMLAHLLVQCGVEASFCIGGDVPSLGGVAAAGRSDVMVVEADESDGTLVLYEPAYAVITNVELDHVDFFTREEELDACFACFARQARRALVYCADDPGAVRAARAARTAGISYGLTSPADWSAEVLASTGRGLIARVRCRGREQGQLEVPVPGSTNLLDALAAVAVAVDYGCPFEQVAGALRHFRPVRRRFEILAERNGVTVISDYAHHPTEIAAFLQQVRGLAPRRVLAVFQPHRYTRTAALGPAFPPAFAGVDELVLVPVYAASETPVPGGTLADLHAHFIRHGRIPVSAAQSLLEAWEYIRKKWRPGDVIAVVGAGDVERIAGWAAAELNEEPGEP